MGESSFDLELVRTNHRYQSDMVAEALEKARVPFSRVQEDIGGMQFAQVFPPHGGLGLQFLIVVPSAMEKKARAILKGLPVALDPAPGLHLLNPASMAKTYIRVLAWAMLLTMAAAMLWEIGSFWH